MNVFNLFQREKIVFRPKQKLPYTTHLRFAMRPKFGSWADPEKSQLLMPSTAKKKASGVQVSVNLKKESANQGYAARCAAVEILYPCKREHNPPNVKYYKALQLLSSTVVISSMLDIILLAQHQE